jgi:LacI family transcriptional regulator
VSVERKYHVRRERSEKRSRRVALIYDARGAYDTKVMSGVAQYIQHSSGWNVYIEENALKDQRLPNLKAWKGDGIIANFDNPRVAAAVVRSKLPAVGFGSGYGWYSVSSDIPYFYTNNRAIAELAVDHLVSRGLRHFAFCGYPKNQINGWCYERRDAFKEALASRGFSCHIYQAKASLETTWVSLQRSIGAWLRSLPKSVGILAANDIRGRQILEACRSCALRVPEDVAVLGVDNDELFCSLSSPVLSSVEQGAKHLGYEAAKLLDKLMKRASIPLKTKRFIIDPFGVITRASTEVLAIEDPHVAKSMTFIAEHYARGIGVNDVVHISGVSRSGLEKKFRARLGFTIATMIRRFQLDRARDLVLTTNLPLKEISANLSFPSVQHMTTLFRKAYGQPPGKLRLVMPPNRGNT